MKILIDSSVWIDYFKGSKKADSLNHLIEQNLVCTNLLILAELIPFLQLKRQNKLIEHLKMLDSIPIEIDWTELIEYQLICLKKGINKVGIPDLMILQNIKQNNIYLYTFDKHFRLIAEYIECKLWTIDVFN